jgi:hypothetical protein
VGFFYLGAEAGVIGCHAESIPGHDDVSHEHEYSPWEYVTLPTEYSEGEIERYCYICGDAQGRIVPESTLGLDYVDNGDGTCTITGISHGPEFNNNLTKIVIPRYIVQDNDGKLVDLEVVAIGADFLGTLGDQRDDIKEIVLPKTLKEIGAYAFSGTGIETIDLPEGITFIGDYAFAECESLIEINLPRYLRELGEGAFRGCINLVKAEAFVELAEIRPHTFEDCTSLERVNIGKIITVGECAFNNCVALRELNIGERFERIESEAFRNCASLESVYLYNIRYIGARAFEYCTALEWVEIYSDNQIIIDNEAFSGCESLRAVSSDDGYGAFPANVFSIGENAFRNCTSLERAIFYTEDIGAYAFCGCSSLSELQFMQGVVYIGESAFADCSSIKSVYLPESVDIVGENAFRNCSSMEWFQTDGPVEMIGYDALYGCDKLSGISLYDMTGVNLDTVFQGNPNITCVMIRSGEVLAHAFRECRALEELILYEGVTAIGDYAFYECDKLVKVTFPETLSHIGESAFERTGIGGQLSIGDHLVYIGDYAFKETEITSLIIASDDAVFGSGVFEYCEISNISIVYGVEKIHDGMFLGIGDALRTIYIPETVTEIGSSAFKNCNRLESIYIPNSVTTIGGQAFENCQHLQMIDFGGTKAEWENIVKGGDWHMGVYFDLTVACSDGDIIYPGINS